LREYEAIQCKAQSAGNDGYPGLIESANPDNKVVGELYKIADLAHAFTILDDYEECSARFAHPHEYVRKRVWVQSGSGEPVRAWTYLYNREATQCLRIICGDYLSFLTRRNGHNP